MAQISNEFSALFEYMGFSGCVKLNKGTHEDDFQNYGFDVFVKFRSALPLTRLDGSFQSKFLKLRNVNQAKTIYYVSL